jgi:hypothetical protein
MSVEKPYNIRKSTLMPPSIQNYRLRLAKTSIGPTTLRNQGASGVVETAREFLANLDLTRFIRDDETAFVDELDRQTMKLKEGLPQGAQHWGTARKAINLFLGDAYYHQFVCKEYGLEKIVEFLEVPLDSQVGYFLTQNAIKAGKVNFPRWAGIIKLEASTNKKYQDFALEYAKAKGDGWARIHLDIVIWGKRDS